MHPFLPMKRMVPMPMPRVLCDALAIWLQAPARGFVFNRPVIFLEAGVAFSGRFLLPTVLVEPGDACPCPVCCCLPGHRVEPGSKRIVLRQLRAEGLQIRLAHTTPIHPEPERLVAHKLRRADGFINGRRLRLMGSEFVLQNQHADRVCERLPGWRSPAWLFEQGSLNQASQRGTCTAAPENTGLLNVFSIRNRVPPLAVDVNTRERRRFIPESCARGASTSPLVKRNSKSSHLKQCRCTVPFHGNLC